MSTGRKPTQTTRKLGRLLSLILHCKYENRGKRSVDEICERAETFGCQKVAFIYEQKGNPSSIQFFDEDLGWLPEIIAISGINQPDRASLSRIPSTIKLIAHDAEGKKMISLLGLEAKEEDAQSPLEGKFSSKGIEFFQGKYLILNLKGKIAVMDGKKEGKEKAL